MREVNPRPRTVVASLSNVPARVLDVMTYVLLTLFARVAEEEGLQGSVEVDGRMLFGGIL
jgi:hypothetical protein